MRTRFAEFTVDSDTRQLQGGGGDIHLSPKAFDLLCLLIEAAPKVVDKADLHARIWPDTHVVDANLNVLIGEIRRAIGDSAQHPTFIRTVHGVGYAFCATAVPAALRPGPGLLLLGGVGRPDLAALGGRQRHRTRSAK